MLRYVRAPDKEKSEFEGEEASGLSLQSCSESCSGQTSSCSNFDKFMFGLPVAQLQPCQAGDTQLARQTRR